MSGKPESGDEKETVREAALYDPDSVFRDYPLESTAARVFQSLIAPVPVSDQPSGSAGGEALYAKSEKKRAAGALTKEMIKRIADRAEQAAAEKKKL